MRVNRSSCWNSQDVLQFVNNSLKLFSSETELTRAEEFTD